jgi:hypothetical protein
LVVFTPALAVTVWYATSTAESEKLQLEYVRIATSILQEPDNTEAQRPIREWAVALLNKSAPIKLSPTQARALSTGEVTLPYSNYDSYDSYDLYEYGPRKHRKPVSPTPTATPR